MEKYKYNNFEGWTAEDLMTRFSPISVDIDDSNDDGYDVNVWSNKNDNFTEICGTCYIEDYTEAIKIAKFYAKKFKAVEICNLK